MKPLIHLPLIVVTVVFLGAVPWFGCDVLTQFGINVLLLAVLAQSWNIIGGFTGYPSFGNSVFYGLGSYGVAIAVIRGRTAVWRGAGGGVRGTAWVARPSVARTLFCHCDPCSCPSYDCDRIEC